VEERERETEREIKREIKENISKREREREGDTLSILQTCLTFFIMAAFSFSTQLITNFPQKDLSPEREREREGGEREGGEREGGEREGAGRGRPADMLIITR
jgi:hypothetical protein